MLLSVVYAVICAVFDLLLARRLTARAQTVEPLNLRHEVRVLRRHIRRTPWRPADRLLLAALSRCAPRAAWGRFPVRPETLPRRHRELVRRQWAAFGRRRRPGRPPGAPEVRALSLRLAHENPARGSQRIRGERRKLGHRVSAAAIQSVLRRHGVPPAPRRAGRAWPASLRAHATGLLACDCLAVETVPLRGVYALFFLEVRTHRVVVAGCTAHPTAAGVTQPTRTVPAELEDADVRPTILLRDRDSTFAAAFDGVVAAHPVRGVRTPFRAPRANAFAERWVGTARRDGRDGLLVLGPRHRERVPREDARHDNSARPHRSLELRPPLARDRPLEPAEAVVRRDRRGGVIHEYERAAA